MTLSIAVCVCVDAHTNDNLHRKPQLIFADMADLRCEDNITFADSALSQKKDDNREIHTHDWKTVNAKNVFIL